MNKSYLTKKVFKVKPLTSALKQWYQKAKNPNKIKLQSPKVDPNEMREYFEGYEEIMKFSY